MAFQRDNSGINERFEALLADAVVQVKTKEDPLVLNDYKKLFKKNVPLVLRSYVAAYLAKQIASGISFETGKHKNGRTPFSRHGRGGEKTGFDGAKTAKKESSAAPRISIDPESAAAVFISIGRNRGVFPRDLIGLIIQRAGIERERIGEIRVLDNYSFVQVYAEDADKIIEALNGTDYRNRKITVSHSRKKDEQDRACEEQTDRLYESSIHDEYDEQTEQSCRTEDGGESSRMP